MTDRSDESEAVDGSRDENVAGGFQEHGTGAVHCIGGRLPPYVCRFPFPSNTPLPDYRALVKRHLDLGQISRIFVGQNPDEVRPEQDDSAGMFEYIMSAVRYGEFPTVGYGVDVLDVLLWAYWAQLSLPEALQEIAIRQGKRANRIIEELWLLREVWPLVEAVNNSRGFPREVIRATLEADECIAPDLYDYVEDVLEERGLGFVDDDGKLYVRRDDFLRIALEEGFWLPPLLREAAERGEQPEAAESSDAYKDLDLPIPNDQWNVTAHYRAYANFYWYLFPNAAPEEIRTRLVPFMIEVVGVDRGWLGSRATTTLNYTWLKGMNNRQGKSGPKPQSTGAPGSTQEPEQIALKGGRVVRRTKK